MLHVNDGRLMMMDVYVQKRGSGWDWKMMTTDISKELKRKQPATVPVLFTGSAQNAALAVSPFPVQATNGGSDMTD